MKVIYMPGACVKGRLRNARQVDYEACIETAVHANLQLCNELCDERGYPDKERRLPFIATWGLVIRDKLRQIQDREIEMRRKGIAFE